MRLQKYIAGQGVASRRRAAEIIRSGRVSINGLVVTEPGTPVAPDRDAILLDHKPLVPTTASPFTILLYKPRGYICSASSAQGRTIYALIPEINERLLLAGRLDKDSEGLLLLSNDGDFINRLTHPRYNHEKEYQVTVSGPITRRTPEELRRPITIDGYTTRPAHVLLLNRTDDNRRAVLQFILKEGRKRQIRQLCRRSGLSIHRLIRVRIDQWTIDGLKPGQWRRLNEHESGTSRLPISRS